MVRSHRFIRPRRSSGSAGVRRARRAMWIVLVGSLAGFTVLMGWSMDAGRPLRDLVLYNLPPLATACLCWWAPTGTRSSRRAWRLLAVAILLAAAGNVCFTLIPDASGVVAPTVSDDLYLAFYPVANIAVVLLVRDHGPRAVPAVWLDGLVVGLGSAAVVAALVLRAAAAPRTRRRRPRPITHLAYPLADLTLADRARSTVGGVTRLRVASAWPCWGWGWASTSSPTSPTSCSTWPATTTKAIPSTSAGYWPSFPLAVAACLRGHNPSPPPPCPPSRSNARQPRHRPWPVSPPSRY